MDRTQEDERPTDIGPNLATMSEVAAHSAGFSTTDDGSLAGVETHYTILVDGQSKPLAETGLLAWGVQVTVRIEDEYGLAEDVTGQSRGSIPYVRAATPDIRAACTHLISNSLVIAFRDVRMQLEYRNATPLTALKGLQSRDDAERWAAMRRLGELRHVESVPSIIEQMDGADAMTAHIAIGVLGRIGGEKAFQYLLTLATEESGEWAMSALKTLWIMDTKRARPILKKVQAEHPSAEVKAFATEILAQPTDPQ